jgi:hypothetical protein
VPRDYFDIMDATQSVPDEAGLDCRDLDEAHRQARTLIADAMTGREATRIDWCAWRVEVRDEVHGLVFTVPFPVTLRQVSVGNPRRLVPRHAASPGERG